MGLVNKFHNRRQSVKAVQAKTRPELIRIAFRIHIGHVHSGARVCGGRGGGGGGGGGRVINQPVG